MSGITDAIKARRRAEDEFFEADDAYTKAMAKLEPLRIAREEKLNALDAADNLYQNLRRPVETSRGRRGRTGPRKVYNITPATKIAAASKRAITRAGKKNPNLTDAEAKKIGRAAEAALSEKLGAAMPGEKVMARAAKLGVSK